MTFRHKKKIYIYIDVCKIILSIFFFFGARALPKLNISRTEEKGLRIMIACTCVNSVPQLHTEINLTVSRVEYCQARINSNSGARGSRYMQCRLTTAMKNSCPCTVKLEVHQVHVPHSYYLLLPKFVSVSILLEHCTHMLSYNTCHCTKQTDTYL